MRSYEAARRICSFLENIGWLAVVGGVILAFVLAESVSSYARPGAAFAAAIPGIVFSVFGLFCVGGVQGWRSSVDTAEYTQQMLKIARDQLEVSRQGLRGQGTPRVSFEEQQEPSAQKSVSFGDSVSTSPDANSDQTDTPSSKLQLTDGTSIDSVEDLEPGQIVDYRGNEIRVVEAGFVFSGTVFRTFDQAKTRIDDALAVCNVS